MKVKAKRYYYQQEAYCDDHSQPYFDTDSGIQLAEEFELEYAAAAAAVGYNLVDAVEFEHAAVAVAAPAAAVDSSRHNSPH